MLSAVGFPKHGLKQHAEIKKSQSDTCQVTNSPKDIEMTKIIKNENQLLSKETCL